MKVTLIMPAYNVARVVAGVIARIPRDICDEIIVLDDGSKDGTTTVLSSIPEIILLQHAENRGYGNAQITLYDTALSRGADIILLMHSDGGHFPEEIPLLLSPIQAGSASVVIGSRIAGIIQSAPRIVRSRILGALSNGPMPIHLFLGHLFLMALHNIAFSTRYNTWHSGFRAMTCQALQCIPYRELSIDYLIDSEILLAAHSAKLLIEEVPVSSYYDSQPGSAVKPFSFGLKAIWFTFSHLLRKYMMKILSDGPLS